MIRVYPPDPVTSPRSEQSGTLSFAWILVLLLLGAGYRLAVPVFDLPWNSAPLIAMAFGGSLMLGVRFWWLPVAVLLVGDLLLGLRNPAEGIAGYTLMSAVVYGFVAFIGARAPRSLKIWPMMWCGTLVCSVLFYGVGNTYTWLAWPGYEKTLAGWWQSQTTGLPEYSPQAWVFLKNSLIADTIWCALAGIVYAVSRRPLAVPAAEPAR